MDCKRSKWQRPLEQKITVAHTLKWPSGLVCLATSIKKNKKIKIYKCATADPLVINPTLDLRHKKAKYKKISFSNQHLQGSINAPLS